MCSSQYLNQSIFYWPSKTRAPLLPSRLALLARLLVTFVNTTHEKRYTIIINELIPNSVKNEVKDHISYLWGMTWKAHSSYCLQIEVLSSDINIWWHDWHFFLCHCMGDIHLDQSWSSCYRYLWASITSYRSHIIKTVVVLLELVSFLLVYKTYTHSVTIDRPQHRHYTLKFRALIH